ncbi:myosin-6 [Helianthus annuus]|uniref:myosin-6 n=1 Tax=Helianthus annuus TaxID=4232 RepID=UPI001653390E|nr:myosin-6 [Helianthus annuus]
MQAVATNIIVGSQVWVEDPEVAWIDGDVLEIKGADIKVKLTTGKEIVIKSAQAYPKDPEAPSCGVDDMTKLAYLHEPGVLENLKSRYNMDEIYTYTGNILIAVNPFKRIPHLYDKHMMGQYKGAALGELSPHPYAIADASYRHMVNEGISQSILVSGESGAGKTESTKNLMQYLAYMGGRPGAQGQRSVEQQVLESNPVLEAFGNAKTVRNNNSSRFGKFVEIQFNDRGKISGAAIRTYLLERSRVCQLSDPERNYHCFYMICAAPPDVFKKYKLGKPQTFHYLNQTNCYELSGVDESKEYLATRKAMDVVGISSDEQEAIFRIVAAILHLGNIEFVKDKEPDSSKPKDDQSKFHLKTAAELFMCDEAALQDSFCKRVIVTRDESIKKSLDPLAAALNRDALAKIVYTRLFDWIVGRINESIGQDPESKSLIGVLDIYGFESFKTNSFEQFCINLTNEKLQQHFNQHVFKMEQEEYTKEEIDWSYIEFVDNQDILDLIEKKPGGILALLDEACMFPRSTHETFAEKLFQTFKDHKRFSKPKLSNSAFTIDHYAGEVTYQTEFFLDKNKDYVVAEQQALLNASKCSFVSNLFPPPQEESSKASKFSSIGTRFKQQLQALLETLSHTEPHYIRCVKPNNLLKPSIFENQNILQQLRCGGVMEAIRISMAGFPTRKPFKEFISRFKIFSPDDVKKSDDDIKTSRLLLEKANLQGYQIGKTKVFLRAGQMAELDARRSEVLGRSASKVQRKFLTYSARKKFNSLKFSSIQLQSMCRGQVGRRHYESRKREVASLRIQKDGRMFLKRKAFKVLSSSAIKIQNGMRGMAARNEYRYKRRETAAVILQTQCRQYLAEHRFCKLKKATITSQSFWRARLARKELRLLRQKAKDTDSLKEAKSKLEKEVEELTWRLQVEKRIRSGLEESKNQENAKWQSIIKEMQEQSEQTKELLEKEREAAKKELEEARANKEASSKEIVDELTAENEKLKGTVSSLEQKVDEAEKKYEESNKLSEERLKQITESETKILELQATTQRLQEKINELEHDEQMLRQQVMLTSSASKRRFSFSSKGQENGHHLDHQGGASMQRFDSNLRQSAIDRHRENVDKLIKATTEDLGFSNGKPVVTYVIYKSLLHWKVFEAERTNVFDRLITVFGAAIQKEEDNKHMAYWLSSTSTLLFLIQKSLSSASGKPPQPTSFIGRMAQSFRKSPSYSNLEIVRQVEGKQPALLFKMQLTAYVEKIYGLVRDNLKKELSQHISCCIQTAREKGNTPPSMFWQHIIESLNGMLKTLEEYHVPTILDQKIFAQVFAYINVQLFNSLLLRRECCSFSHGEYLKTGLTELELWCSHATEEYADSSWEELKHTRQAVGFLVVHQKSKIKYDHLITELCPILNVQQLYKICTHYADDIYKTPSVDPTVISDLKGHTEGLENADNTSFLLEDDPCIPFTVDDLVNFLHEKDFAEMKPTCYLVDNPDFKFLVE